MVDNALLASSEYRSKDRNRSHDNDSKKRFVCDACLFEHSFRNKVPDMLTEEAMSLVI